jgi:hypothetical protein
MVESRLNVTLIDDVFLMKGATDYCAKTARGRWLLNLKNCICLRARVINKNKTKRENHPPGFIKFFEASSTTKIQSWP